jgi:hypothetical protein
MLSSIRIMRGGLSMECNGIDVPVIGRLRGRWRLPAVAVIAAAVLLAGMAWAQAGVVITVDKSTQRLSVAVDGVQRYEWPVSTARKGYVTPNGTYHPQRLARKWYSHKYDMSPMPYSIFFDGGYAIHGSYETSRIGRPASHGCVRLKPAQAAVLFKLVKRNRDDTRIIVTGERPSHAVARVRPSHRAAEAKDKHWAHRARRRRRVNASRYAHAQHWREPFAEVFSAAPDYGFPQGDFSVRDDW